LISAQVYAEYRANEPRIRTIGRTIGWRTVVDVPVSLWSRSKVPGTLLSPSLSRCTSTASTVRSASAFRLTSARARYTTYGVRPFRFSVQTLELSAGQPSLREHQFQLF